MEAIWVAAEMRAGAAFAHSIIAIDEMAEAGPPQRTIIRSTRPAQESIMAIAI